ncbi:MAG: hypothetical protein ACTTIJ_06005 [Dialister pneumosintes]
MNYLLELLIRVISLLPMIFTYFSIKLEFFNVGEYEVVLALFSMFMIAFVEIHLRFRKYTRLEISEDNHVQFYEAGRTGSLLELIFELKDIEEVQFQNYYFEHCVRLIIKIRNPLIHKWT